MRLRHVSLLGAAIAGIVSMAAIAALILGRKWLWFGAGTAAVLLAVHVTLNHIALGLGGVSVLGYVGRWLHGQGAENAPRTTGKVIHWALRYDLLVWLMTGGRERAFRGKTIELARLSPGESVLDAGCGTGGLAIAAKRRAGAAGKVCGIDASPEMIARARRKARKAGVDVNFETGVIEAL